MCYSTNTWKRSAAFLAVVRALPVFVELPLHESERLQVVPTDNAAEQLLLAADWRWIVQQISSSLSSSVIGRLKIARFYGCNEVAVGNRGLYVFVFGLSRAV